MLHRFYREAGKFSAHTDYAKTMKQPAVILNFSPAPAFTKRFLFHPALTDAASTVHWFHIGQSGYGHDKSRWRSLLAEYLRAISTLGRGLGDVNAATLAYCHTTKYAFPSLLLCRLFGVGRVIYYNHGVPYVGHRGLLRLALQLLEQINLAIAHDFVTVTPGMVGLLRPGVAVDPWRHSIRPGSSSGLQTQRYVNSTVARQRARQRSNRGTRFLYAGRLQTRKGVFVLLEAWRAHIATHPADELWLCGFTSGDLAMYGTWAALPNLVAKGYVDDMTTVYDAVDVVVSPSFHEGFGYTLLEGAARACCIVSSAVPGPDVIFTPWMRHLMFEAGNSTSLQQVMARLSSRPGQLANGRLLAYRSALRFQTHKLTYPDFAPVSIRIPEPGTAARP